MPRKTKYSSEEVVAAAFDLVREQGWAGLSTAAVAAKMGCSTMPIYSHFKNLEELEHAVLEQGYDRLMEYETRRFTGDLWIDQAIGYVLFAREEKQLFRCMHDGRHLNLQRELRKKNWEFLGRFLESYEPFQTLSEETAGRIRYSRAMMTQGLASMVNMEWNPLMLDERNIFKYITQGSQALFWGLSQMDGMADQAGLPKCSNEAG